MPKFLITGTSSGLGRYLLEELRGTPFRRADIENELESHRQKYYDAIIHCAVDGRQIIPANELWAYHRSNIELTKKLTEIPHGLFVFTSSCAVYPDPFRENSETDIPNFPETNPPPQHIYYLYGLFKLLAEQIVSRNTKRSLILRCVSMIGRTGRLNNVIKVLRNDPGPLTLSPDSSFNLVSMDQIKRFIELALTQNITGIFNTSATQNATLEEIARAVGSRPTFGNFTYNVPRLNTDKIRGVSRDFDKNSIEIAVETANDFKRKGAKL